MRKDIFFCKETFERNNGLPKIFKKGNPYYFDFSGYGKDVDLVKYYWLKEKDEERSPSNPDILVKLEDFKKYFVNIREHNLNEALK